MKNYKLHAYNFVLPALNNIARKFNNFAKLYILLASILVIIFMGIRLVHPISAQDASVLRQTEYKIFVNSKNPEQSVTQIIRRVYVKTARLVLLKNNYEYINVCPSSGEIKDLANIKKTLYVKSLTTNYKLSYKVETNGNCLLVKVAYPYDIRAGDSLQLVVGFNDKTTVTNNGGLLEVVYPRLNEKPVLSSSQVLQGIKFTTLHTINVIFVLDKNLNSSVHTYVAGSVMQPVKPYVYYDNQKVYLKYNLLDVWKTGIYLVIGNVRTIRFNLKISGHSIDNTAQQFLNTLDNFIGFRQVIIPRSDKITNQVVYYDSITPKPLSVKVNEYGNLLASFKGGEDINIIGYAQIYYKPLNVQQVSKVLLKDYKLSPLMQEYVLPSYPYWPSDNSQIVDIATNLKASTVLQTVINDVNFILDHIEYNENADVNSLTRKGALEALSSGNGVCMEFADTLITLLRAQGIASRAVLGNVLSRFVEPDYRNVGHEWVEVYFPDYGWLMVDPTLSDKNNIVMGQNLNYFAYFKAATVDDLTQLKCLSWSGSCSNLQMSISFLNDLHFKDSLLKEADLFKVNSESNISKANTFLYANKIQNWANFINIRYLDQKLPEINITTAYIIFFILLYLIVYFVVFLIRKLVRFVYIRYKIRKLKNLSSHGKRIVNTVAVSQPVTSSAD